LGLPTRERPQAGETRREHVFIHACALRVPTRAQALSCLTPRHIAKVGRLHLRGLFAYQNKLANALANANAEGEDVRAQERMSIFGYAMMHEPA
jgi:hypothetical protein